MVEILSPRGRLFLLTVMVALVLIFIMEFFNVELFFGGGGIRALIAIVIAIAISIAFERISEKINYN